MHRFNTYLCVCRFRHQNKKFIFGRNRDFLLFYNMPHCIWELSKIMVWMIMVWMELRISLNLLKWKINTGNKKFLEQKTRLYLLFKSRFYITQTNVFSIRGIFFNLFSVFTNSFAIFVKSTLWHNSRYSQLRQFLKTRGSICLGKFEQIYSFEKFKVQRSLKVYTHNEKRR